MRGTDLRQGAGPDGRRHRHPGFGPGFGFGPGGPGRGRGRGRAPRGDVRTAILLLLAEEPMHGYQLISTIAERTEGRWSPSPGAIYPALSLLEDEGLVIAHADQGRKVCALTESGRALVDAERGSWPDPFATDPADGRGGDLRRQAMQLLDAVRQVGRAGSPAQIEATAEILGDARRRVYLLLAGPGDDGDSPA